MKNLINIIHKKRLVEKEIMSHLFTYPNLITKVLSRVNTDDFTSFRKVFEIFEYSFKNDKNPLTEIIVAKIHASDFVGDEIVRDIESACNELVEINKTIKVYDIFEKSLNEISSSNSNNINSFVSDFQRNLVKSVSSKEVELSTAESIISSYLERQKFYKEKFKNGGIIGISTGYPKIDDVIDGFRPEHLWVVGGYTNFGKTATALNFVSNLIKNNHRVVYYSLEMSKMDILSRLLGIMTKQNGLSILKGYNHNQEEVEIAIKQIKKSGLSIYNEKSNIADIENSMFEETTKCPVDLFVLDFLQLVGVRGAKSEYETISTAILELQQTARKLKVPIMVLSQISNEGARNGSETVMSFKGSGSIASASDLAIEIEIGETDKTEWKRKMKDGEPVNMIWNIRKNRHGRVGSLDMTFNGATGVFEISDFEQISKDF